MWPWSGANESMCFREWGGVREWELGFICARADLEGAADGAFVVDVELAELMEGFVVGLDGGVVRLELQGHLPS